LATEKYKKTKFCFQEKQNSAMDSDQVNFLIRNSQVAGLVSEHRRNIAKLQTDFDEHIKKSEHQILILQQQIDALTAALNDIRSKLP